MLDNLWIKPEGRREECVGRTALPRKTSPARDSRGCPGIGRGQALLGFGGVVPQSQKIYKEHSVISAHVLRTPEVCLTQCGTLSPPGQRETQALGGCSGG